MSSESINDISSGVGQPDSIDPEEISSMGTTPTPDYDSSPDVAPDGSLVDDSPAEDDDPPKGQRGYLKHVAEFVRAIWNTLRATVRAPFAVLWRYLLPLLAFALVFGAVAYLSL